MLCGLLKPSAGEIDVLGYRMPGQAEPLRSRIGYMTQRFSLYEDLSVGENMHFMAAVYSLPFGQRRQRVREQLQHYALWDRRGQRAGTLSGGQKQRLALAAVTLHQPELLLLDEPTSGVDPRNRRDFWENLFELAAAGMTILVSTHYMDEAERCHNLAILDRGRLAATGSPAQMIRDIDVQVVSVDTDAIRDARQILEDHDTVRTVTQLGNNLHVLLVPGLADAAAWVEETLAGANIEASARLTAASLEDVFVAATGYARGEA
jgi:ABC-2 type transport system ATP-binding protein